MGKSDEQIKAEQDARNLSEQAKPEYGAGTGQKQVYQQEVQTRQKQEQARQQAKLPHALQSLINLVGPEQPKGQLISPGEPKLTPQEYQVISKKHTPRPTVLKNCAWAFGIGGLICAIAQVLTNILHSFGLDGTGLSSTASIVMIFLGSLLTGLGIYDEIGRRAGAGSIVPVTGFANSMVAPAMEFKREGYVFGVGAKLFTIAGPVLVYGIVTSVIIGLIKYFLR